MNRITTSMARGVQITARSDAGISNDELRAVVPSIFAVEAHESRSARFAPIPTVTVLDGLRREGFVPMMAAQSRSRIPGKAEYTRHLLRMRHVSLTNDKDEAFEVLLTNANDGTSAYKMFAGCYRFVCANGMCAGDTFGEVKVRHSGNPMGDVIEGCYRVLDDAPAMLSHIDAFKSITLNRDEQEAFAEAAHVLRFPDAYADPETRRAAPIPTDMLLRARRSEDRANDLWRTFNRVQENTVKGGQLGQIINAQGNVRNSRTRPVNGISQSTALNAALWSLTERMAELKAAA
jgi:hypothetical protein